jgi:Cu+-exporting ATPase
MDTETTKGYIGPLVWGVVAFGGLMAMYFAVLTLVSGWSFTLGQFNQYWYYIVLLGVGFALQVGLFVRLRELVASASGTKTVMAASGTTSAAAMVSCCTHYLVNLAPILGAAGLVTFVSQYQIQFFWVGLAFNAAGLAYIGRRLAAAAKEHAKCATS